MFVKEVIWDGENVHLMLFGSDYKYEFPETPVGIGNKLAQPDEEVNFDVAAERWNVELLGEYSKPSVYAVLLISENSSQSAR